MRISRSSAVDAAKALGVGLVSAVLLAVRLFYPRPVGVADNYDGQRLMCHLSSAMHRVGNAGDQLRDYVTFRYDRTPAASCHREQLGGINLPHTLYQSSQVLVLYAGRAAMHVLGFPGYLDLRAVAIICVLMIGGALGLLFWALRWRDRYRLLTCALALAVVADALFIDYAAAPFSEIASIIGTLYLVGAAVLLARPERGRRAAGLVVGVPAGIFMLTSKTQDAILVVPMTLLLVAFPFPFRAALRGGGGCLTTMGPLARVTRLDARLRHRLVPMLAAAGVAAAVVALWVPQDKQDGVRTRADFVTNRLVAVSPAPVDDLAKLGGIGIYVPSEGSPEFCLPGAVPPNAAFQRFFNSLTYRRIAVFLATHPERGLRVADAAAEDFLNPRPTAVLCQPHALPTTPLLANYAAGHGTPPNTVDRRYAPVTEALGALRGGGVAVLGVLWVVPLAAAVWTRRNRRDEPAGDVAVAVLFLVPCAVIQFVVSAYGDGIDTAKHLNLAVFATALGWALAIPILGGAVLRRFTRARGARRALEGVSVLPGAEPRSEPGLEPGAEPVSEPG